MAVGARLPAKNGNAVYLMNRIVPIAGKRAPVTTGNPLPQRSILKPYLLGHFVHFEFQPIRHGNEQRLTQAQRCTQRTESE